MLYDTTRKRVKLLYLVKLLYEKTDSTHGVTTPEIISYMGKLGISVERKTVYADIEELKEFGLDIVKEKTGGDFFYKLDSREFELSELKLLVDAVQSAKFISERKSLLLIRKLEKLASVYEGALLNRDVEVGGRVKSMNESVSNFVDTIYNAIGQNRRIAFRYCNWNMKKEMAFRRGGRVYEISPWALVWDDEYYYMVGYDSECDDIRHYRVDKMRRITITEKRREGEKMYRESAPASYGKSHFRMFNGERTQVTLRSENRLVGVIIDQFGKDVMLIPDGEHHFTVNVTVSMSDQFLSWVIALKGGVQIIAPDSAVEKMRELLNTQISLYS